MNSLRNTLNNCMAPGISWVFQRTAISAFRLHSATAFALGSLRIRYSCILNATALGFVVAPLSQKSRLVSRACNYLSLFGPLNLIHNLCLTTFIHEAGHSIAAISLYASRTFPEIKIDLFGGGTTKAFISQLSPLGTYLGTERSLFLFAAAGPFSSLAFAMGMFGWASYQTDDTTSARMMLHGGIQLLSELEGARHASSNDYEAMKRLGGVESKHVFRALIILPALQLMWIHRRAIAQASNRIKDLVLNLFQSKNRAPR